MMRTVALLFYLLMPVLTVLGENRFPQPQFESGYSMPAISVPAPRVASWELLDVLVLGGALSLAAWLILKKRSRRGVFLLTVFSLLYFGFWRKGCVCSIGGIQNVAAWLSGNEAVLPLSVAAFFILPLVFALFFGRVFCAAVCPLGAIQEMMILFPKRLPRPVSLALGMVPVVYLGLAVLLAATGSAFIICRHDPFVPIFRLGGELSVLLAGVFLLLVGIVVARPFCRFLCPYGVLLNWASRLSKWHATITPDECVKCRLCERACPFDAIRVPVASLVSESRGIGVRRMKWLLLLLVFLTGIGLWTGSRLEGVLAPINSKVKLDQVLRSNHPAVEKKYALELEAFRSGGRNPQVLRAEAEAVRRQFRVGGACLGGFLGFVFGMSMVGVSIRRSRDAYEPDRGECLSCARCFRSCPKEQKRLKP
jgi:polyferredoxin